jgi:ribosomal protein L11 methyltransferase
MTPFALTVITTPALAYDLAEQLGFDALNDALSVSVFDQEDGMMQVQALYETSLAAQKAADALPHEIKKQIVQLPETDWVSQSQAGLAPILAGRFVVHGSHDTPDKTVLFPICIDAGTAFGTGHHGTTKGCLLMLDSLTGSDVPKRILDLGTGSGVLAIAAAKRFPPATIFATDIDAEAVKVAKTNAAINGVDFSCIQADGFGAAALKNQRFDLIIANILAGPLKGLAPDIANALAEKGRVILSGILDAQADNVADTFRAQGLRVEKKPSLDGWTSLWAVRP